MSHCQTNPAEDSMVSKNDHVGYEVDNTHESASEQWRDTEVNKTKVHEIDPTEGRGVSNNHHLVCEEYGGTGKLNWMQTCAPNLLAQLITFLTILMLVSSIFWGIKTMA